MPPDQAVDEVRRAYSILGVPPAASPEEIRQRYLHLVKEWHPDRHSHDSVAQWRANEKTKRLNEAYARVKDAPLRSGRTAATVGDSRSSRAPTDLRPEDFAVATSRARTSNMSLAAWLAIGLGLYALGDSLLALFGVSLIRESGARLDDVRRIALHGPGEAAYGWQSWIVSFGDAAERVLGVRALFGLTVAYAGLALLRHRSWARAALVAACSVVVICGVIGAGSMLRSDWARHTTVPIEAVLMGALAAYILRLLFRVRDDSL